MAATAYEWAQGRGRSVPAQLVGEEIERIAARDGECHPAVLQREHRRMDAPLHPLFESDIDVGFDNWRTHQARQVIASVRLAIPIEVEERYEGPAFVHVRRLDDEGEVHNGYVPVKTAMGDPNTADAVLKDALRQLEGWAKRYGWLGELGGVRDAIREVAATYGVDPSRNG